MSLCEIESSTHAFVHTLRFRCPAFTFKCRYGACISKTNKCNGARNCADGSDEDGCPTTTQKPIKVNSTVTSTTQLSVSFNSR